MDGLSDIEQLTPTSQVAPQPTPEPGGRLRSLLSNFFQGAGGAMMKQVGLPTPQELQQQEFSNQLRLRQQKSLEDYHDVIGENAGLKLELQQNKQRGPLITATMAAQNQKLLPYVDQYMGDALTKIAVAGIGADASTGNTQTKEGGLNTRLTQSLDSREAITKMMEQGKNERAKFLQRTLGSYSPLMDEQGNVTGFYNTKNPLNIIRPPENIGRKTAMPAETQRMGENAASGLRALDHFEQMIKSDPNQLILEAIPGGIGAREMKAAKNEVADVITRLRTGAALNESEEKFYRSQMPGALDLSEPEAMKYKIGLLRDLFTGLQQRGRGISPNRPPGGGGSQPPGKTIPYHFPDGSIRNIRPDQAASAEARGAKRQ